MGGKKPLRRPLWPPTRATASNYYPLGLDGAGGAAKPLLRAPKKPAPLHGRLPAFSGAVDAFERARKCFLEWRYFFSIILSEFLKNRVALHRWTPFLLFSGDKKLPKVVEDLGRLLPPAMMGLLVVYSLRSIDLLGGSHGIPEAIAVAVTAGLHLWRRNTLLSILAGTACYMLLVQLVF